VRLNRASAIILFAVLAGCGSLGGTRLAQLALPTPEQLPCCWQSQERVRVTTPEGELELMTAIARTPGKLAVVVLDSLGRRLLTLEQAGAGLQDSGRPASWSPDLSRQIVLAVYLHHLPDGQWQFQQPGWTVQRDGAGKLLAYRERTQLRLDYLDEGGDSGRPRRLTLPGQDVSLHIVTLSRVAL
jgi:hypothetical protein